MESVFAAIGLIAIITVVNVADSFAAASDAEATALAASGDSLVKTYDWAFQWGPGLVAGIGNGVLLGYLISDRHSCRHAWPCSVSSVAPC